MIVVTLLIECDALQWERARNLTALKENALGVFLIVNFCG